MQLSIITQSVKRRFCHDFYTLDKVQKIWVSKKSGMLPLRVSLIEVLVMNIKNLVKTILGKKVVRYNYEEVGNYVYSISLGEIEKVAVAMNLNAVAFKGINDYYQPGVEYEKATNNSKLFKKVKGKISFQNWQCQLKLKQYSSRTAIIFKEKLKSDIAEELRKQGYKVIFLPSNTYI